MSRLLIIATVVLAISCANYTYTGACIVNCSANLATGNCFVNFDQQHTLPSDTSCVQSYLQTSVCSAYYGCDVITTDPDTTEFPAWCLACITQSPSKSQTYKEFQTCVKNSCKGQWHILTLFVLTLLILVL